MARCNNVSLGLHHCQQNWPVNMTRERLWKHCDADFHTSFKITKTAHLHKLFKFQQNRSESDETAQVGSGSNFCNCDLVFGLFKNWWRWPSLSGKINQEAYNIILPKLLYRIIAKINNSWFTRLTQKLFNYF